MRLQVLNASDQDAPGDAVMKDAANESQIDEICTGGNFALFMAQVYFFFFEIQDHLLLNNRGSWINFFFFEFKTIMGKLPMMFLD